MDKQTENLLKNLREKDGSIMTNEELELSIMIPYYYLFDDDEFCTTIKADNFSLEREPFMKQFNKSLKKVKKQYALGEKDE